MCYVKYWLRLEAMIFTSCFCFFLPTFITTGQERFGNMTRVYYREAMGAFIVFDVTRPATFEAVTKWKEDLDSKLVLPNGKPVPTVLLANKCDQGIDVLMNNGIKMDQFCKENGFVGWFETSAKVMFQFLFKYFSLHGEIGSQNSSWSWNV